MKVLLTFSILLTFMVSFTGKVVCFEDICHMSEAATEQNCDHCINCSTVHETLSSPVITDGETSLKKIQNSHSPIPYETFLQKIDRPPISA